MMRRKAVSEHTPQSSYIYFCDGSKDDRIVVIKIYNGSTGQESESLNRPPAKSEFLLVYNHSQQINLNTKIII